MNIKNTHAVQIGRHAYFHDFILFQKRMITP
jgi:hypothetical protein